jgi:hypothetical protein
MTSTHCATKPQNPIYTLDAGHKNLKHDNWISMVVVSNSRQMDGQKLQTGQGHFLTCFCYSSSHLSFNFML